MNLQRHSAISLFFLLSATSTTASADCARGTPSVNQVVFDSVTNIDEIHRWFSKEFDIAAGYGWTPARGLGHPFNTELEYNKLFVAAMLLGKGIDSTELAITSHAPFRYVTGQIYLNRAHHRSQDEWQPLIADTKFIVCDELNDETGHFDCPKHGIWPFRSYSTFGYETYTEIADADPYNVPNGENGTYTKKSATSYFCPAFEDEQGRVDEMTAASLVYTMASLTWIPLQLKNGQKQNSTKFWSGAESARHSAIAREPSENDMSSWQVASRALCDATEAPQNWVPLMAIEIMNQASNDDTDEVHYSNTPEGKSPFTCGIPTDILTLTPGVDLCPNGNLACSTDADCPSVSGGVAPYACNAGCCEQGVIVK